MGRSYSDFDESEEISNDGKALDTEDNKVAEELINGLGGIKNIVDVDNCISRLRIEIKDRALINEDLIKKSKPNGIIIPDNNNVHIVYGGRVTKMRNLIDDYIFATKA